MVVLESPNKKNWLNKHYQLQFFKLIIFDNQSLIKSFLLFLCQINGQKLSAFRTVFPGFQPEPVKLVLTQLAKEQKNQHKDYN